MEHLEGRQSVLAALEARQRRFQVILVSHGAHVEKIQDLLDKAAALNVPVRHVDRKELDALAHGATHGGVIAVVSPKPRLAPAQLMGLVDGLKEPALLLLIEGIEDARNLGFVIRTAEATGVHAVLVKKHLWDLDPVEIARPASGAYERMPLAQIEDVAPLKDLQRRGLRLIGCLAGIRDLRHAESDSSGRENGQQQYGEAVRQQPAEEGGAPLDAAVAVVLGVYGVAAGTSGRVGAGVGVWSIGSHGFSSGQV